MYQVYSPQRPGRPRLAILLSALALLACCLLAWLLIRSRTLQAEITLAEPTHYRTTGVKIRWPEGWSEIETTSLPDGYHAVADTSDGNPLTAGRFFLFRAMPRSLGVPAYHGLESFLESVQAISGEKTLKNVRLEALGPSRLGALPAWDALALTGDNQALIGRTAVGPGGELFGVVLEIGQMISLAGSPLLDAVCESVEFTDLELSDDGSASCAQAGLRLDVALDARFASASWLKMMPMVQLMSPADVEHDVWYLAVYRVPLVRDRTIAGLVEDRILSTMQMADMPVEPSARLINKRPYVDATVVTHENAEAGVHVAALQADESTALLMIGRFQFNGQVQLLEQCDTIARHANVETITDTIDIEAGLDQGRLWLSKVEERGLEWLFGEEAHQRRTYEVRSPGSLHGIERYVLRSSGTSMPSAISAQVERVYTLLSEVEHHINEDWLLFPDGNGHRLDRHDQFSTRTTMEYREKTILDEGQRWLDRRLRTLVEGRWQQQNTTIELQPEFASELALLSLARHAAQSSQTEPIVFCTTEAYSRGLVWWVLSPDGQAPLPDGNDDAPARAYWLQRDYDPDPIRLYFTESKGLEVIEFTNGIRSVLIDTQNIEKQPEPESPATLSDALPETSPST